MQTIIFDHIKKADCIGQLTSTISLASKKPLDEKFDYIDFITKQYNAQAIATGNKAFALATAKRRACAFLGGTEEQYAQMLTLEHQSTEIQPEPPKATKTAKPRKKRSKQLELAVA